MKNNSSTSNFNLKKFLKKILYFILPIIILLYPLDYFISYYLSQSNEFEGVYESSNDVYNSAINSDIALYGSSRSRVHIDPMIIYDSVKQNAYNFGIDGHNFWIQHLRHLELIQHNEKPKVIVHSLDVQTLSKRDNLYLFQQFLPYMLFNKNIFQYTKSYDGFKTLDYFIPLLRYRGEWKVLNTAIQSFLNKETRKKVRNRGYAAREKPWDSRFKNNQIFKKKITINLHQESLNLYEEFILSCKNSNIELILVFSPEYKKGQEFITNRDSIIQLYEQISKKHDLVFIDYSDDEICNDKSLFFDATHLNRKGSILFSQKLASDLKNHPQIKAFK